MSLHAFDYIGSICLSGNMMGFLGITMPINCLFFLVSKLQQLTVALLNRKGYFLESKHKIPGGGLLEIYFQVHTLMISKKYMRRHLIGKI